MTPILWMAAGAVTACVLLLWHDVRHATTQPTVRKVLDRFSTEPDRIERAQQIRLRSAMLRDELDANAREFSEMHGCDWNSDASDELEAVIWAGASYDEAIERIVEGFH